MTTNAAREAPATEAKVAFLSRPGSYHGPTGDTRSVEVVETHMAWVFLTDAHAFKMKKPVRHEFLDFSTLAARERDCREEVRLNRRLAPHVYLDVTALTLAPDGALRLGGEGRPVEWLVRMARLPGERMLDRAIVRGSVATEDLAPVVELLGRFYAGLPPEPLAPDDYLGRLRAEVERERCALLAQGRMDPERVRDAGARLTSLLDRLADPIGERVRAGRIVEGHGDLRPEHVCLGPEPAVIDCLEFERDFRVVDSADDLAYLALECEQLGAQRVGREIAAGVARVTGDEVPHRLSELHAARRAYLRTKLAIWHLRDPDVRDGPAWTRKAEAYLTAAERHLAAAGA